MVLNAASVFLFSEKCGKLPTTSGDLRATKRVGKSYRRHGRLNTAVILSILLWFNAIKLLDLFSLHTNIGS